MGNENSVAKEPTQDEIQALSQETHFNVQEIAKLYAEYKRIASEESDDKVISADEFFPHLGVQNPEYGRRVFDAFDSSKDGKMQFGEYVKGISHVCERASIEERARFCFNLYDNDNSGFIKSEEIFDILSVSLSSNPMIKIPINQVKGIARNLFKDLDKSKDGKISFDEFLQVAKKNDAIVNCVNLRIQPILDK